MNIQKKDQYKYALASPTSMGVRITPLDQAPVHTSQLFQMQVTSAETNVLNVASSLGMECLALTKFVKGSPIAGMIRKSLKSRNITCIGPETEQGGPWGLRHQFNIADSGFGARAPRVWNDRAGEVGRLLNSNDYDIEAIFKKEGVAILHVSGLIAALSEETTKCCLDLIEYAKSAGSLISFDLNYRESFWKDREDELSKAFEKIVSMTDVLIGNEEDYQLCLGFEGPDTGGRELKAKIANYQEMISRVKNRFPQIQVFATTLRQVLNANEHLWGALLHMNNNWFIEEPRMIKVKDRIGGGDGFAGGLLYGILKSWEPQRCLEFGWASGVLAASSWTDYAEPADEKQVFDIYTGNARVQR